MSIFSYFRHRGWRNFTCVDCPLWKKHAAIPNSGKCTLSPPFAFNSTDIEGKPVVLVGQPEPNGGEKCWQGWLVKLKTG